MGSGSVGKLKRAPLCQGKMHSAVRRHYYRIILWANQDDYEVAVSTSGKHSGTTAMCITETWSDEDDVCFVNPKLGEIHFVSGTWDVNTVAHEVQHAVLHRLRYISPGPERVLEEWRPDWDNEDEEAIAYEAGDWVEALLIWLSDNDPESPYANNVFRR